MHPPSVDPVDLAAVRLLVQQRFGRRTALLAAWLEAVLGRPDLVALTPEEGRRLQALLESRSDAELERQARRGDAGRTRLAFTLEVVLDGEPTEAERTLLAQRLLETVRASGWSLPSLPVRTVLLTDG